MVSPANAIITAGNKRFNGTFLPQASVIQRYVTHKARIWRTDLDDQAKSPDVASTDDNIVVRTDGTKKGTSIAYVALQKRAPAGGIPAITKWIRNLFKVK